MEGCPSRSGAGLRVLVDGAWGFAGTADTLPEAIRAAARQAVDLARAAATTIAEPLRLADVEPAVDSVPASVQIDPDDVPLEDRIALLMECDRLMRAEGVQIAIGAISALHQAQHFASSEGASIYQARVETGGMLEATCIAGCGACRRSYPSSHGGQVMSRGWELIEEIDLPGHAAPIAAEARMLPDAPE